MNYKEQQNILAMIASIREGTITLDDLESYVEWTEVTL